MQIFANRNFRFAKIWLFYIIGSRLQVSTEISRFWELHLQFYGAKGLRSGKALNPNSSTKRNCRGTQTVAEPKLTQTAAFFFYISNTQKITKRRIESNYKLMHEGLCGSEISRRYFTKLL